MKPVEFQDDEACLKFEKNITAMNRAINSLITNPPVPGCVLKHSKQLKSHLLFDLEISIFLRRWKTLGAVDEQNIEGVHPQFNQLVRRFGNTRGRRRQQLVMDEFLFSHPTWIVQTVDSILRKTKRNAMRDKGAVSENNNIAPSDSGESALGAGPLQPTQPLFNGQGGADEDVSSGEVGNPAVVAQPNRRGDEDEAVDGLFPNTAALSDLERQINSNTAFHGLRNINTKIAPCHICKCRLLQFAQNVHCHEVHTEHALEEMDN